MGLKKIGFLVFVFLFALLGLNAEAAISGGTQRGADTSAAYIAPTTATTTQIVALSSGQKIKVYNIIANVGNGQVLTFVYGTGTNCATGMTPLTHGINYANGAGTMGIFVAASPNYPIFIAPAGQALCITTGSAVTNTGITISYIQEP